MVPFVRLSGLSLLLCLLLTVAHSQSPALPGQPVGLDNTPQRDTSRKKLDTDWDETDARIWYRSDLSEVRHYPDTSFNTLQRFQGLWAGWRDLGNLASAAQPLLWAPRTTQVTPSLNFPVFDAFRFWAEAADYYNTTRPYSQFQYRMGSKLEQLAELLHTQNIRPQWNFVAQYRKITSPGFFRTARINHDNARLNSSYQSKNLRYQLLATLPFNNMQQDENGGIVSEDDLTDDRYTNRATVPVRISSQGYSTRRSPVSNAVRDTRLLLQHGYTFGPVDTVFNADSTAYDVKLKTHFRILHSLDAGSMRHTYLDLRPDSPYYDFFFARSFATNDSLYVRQRWYWLDNQFSLQQFFNLAKNRFLVSGGLGYRTDAFRNEVPGSTERNTQSSTYLAAKISNLEADSIPGWQLSGDLKFFFAGPSAGNLLLNATLGRIREKRPGFELYFRQQIGEAPYNYQFYRNEYFRKDYSFAKESSTTIGARAQLPYGIEAGFQTRLLLNFLYTDSLLNFRQQSTPFNILQGNLKKCFSRGIWESNHEILIQKTVGDAPVHVPLYTGLHTLGIRKMLFKKAVDVATGLQVYYNTPFKADGYSPILNRFYFQDAVEISNIPELGAYFNFKVKRFRATFSADQLQQLVFRKNVIRYPHYPAQSFVFRFGFVWILLN